MPFWCRRNFCGRVCFDFQVEIISFVCITKSVLVDEIDLGQVHALVEPIIKRLTSTTAVSNNSFRFDVDV